MTETLDQPKPISRGFRTGIAVATLGLDYIGIAGILLWGDPANSLHSSGLAWLCTGAILILGGIGIAAVAPQAVQNLTSNKT